MGLAAFGLFSLHDAAIKFLVADVPVRQVLFVRTVTILVVCVAIGRGNLIARAIETPLKHALFWRGVLNLTAWLCFYTAARALPLAQLESLYFTAPLFITTLAWLVLKEHVTRNRWISVIIGFAGVVCATDPLGVPASLPTLLVLVAAAFWSYGVILMRLIARRESTLLQMLAVNMVFAVGTGLGSLWHWEPVSAEQIALMVAVGSIGGLAQYAVFEAARLIPASVMATVEYSGLPWAFILGFAIWRDIPAVAVFAGASLIVLAGGLLVWAERNQS